MKTPLSDKDCASIYATLHIPTEGSRWLHLFAGSGNLSLNLLRLGAQFVTFVDINHAVGERLRLALKNESLDTKGEIRCTDSFLYVKNTKKIFNGIIVSAPSPGHVWIDMMNCLAERLDLLSTQGTVLLHVAHQDFEQRNYQNLIFNKTIVIGPYSIVRYTKI